MSVKRYDPTMNSEEYTGREYVSMCEDECGEYVKHTDYAALASELAEIERLQRALDAAAVDNEQYRQANDLLTRELAEEVASHDKTREIQTAAQVRVLMLRERLEEARELLASAVDVVAACHDCIRIEAPGLHAKIGAFLAATKEGER
jgi:hypothetical protein